MQKMNKPLFVNFEVKIPKLVDNQLISLSEPTLNGSIYNDLDKHQELYRMYGTVEGMIKSNPQAFREAYKDLAELKIQSKSEKIVSVRNFFGIQFYITSNYYIYNGVEQTSVSGKGYTDKVGVKIGVNLKKRVIDFTIYERQTYHVIEDLDLITDFNQIFQGSLKVLAVSPIMSGESFNGYKWRNVRVTLQTEDYETLTLTLWNDEIEDYLEMMETHLYGNQKVSIPLLVRLDERFGRQAKIYNPS